MGSGPAPGYEPLGLNGSHYSVHLHLGGSDDGFHRSDDPGGPARSGRWCARHLYRHFHGRPWALPDRLDCGPAGVAVGIHRAPFARVAHGPVGPMVRPSRLVSRPREPFHTRHSFSDLHRGWRNGHQSREFGTEYHPLGKLIGWIDGGDIYLDAQAAYAEVQELARHQGDRIAVTLPTLKKRLYEKGLLASTQLDGTKVRLEVRRRLQGRQKRVLHICETTLVSYYKKVDSVDSDTPNSQDFERHEDENIGI